MFIHGNLQSYVPPTAHVGTAVTCQICIQQLYCLICIQQLRF